MGRNTSSAHLAAVKGVLHLQATSIGQPIMRKEAYDKVTGAAKYAGDMAFRSLLHARTVNSPHAHARTGGAVCGGQMEVLVEAWRPEPDFWDGS